MAKNTSTLTMLYAVGALGAIALWMITDSTLLLLVFIAIVIIGTMHLMRARRMSGADAVHQHAAAETIARRGNVPPERRGNF